MSNKTLSVLALVLAFVFPIAGLILGIVALVEANKSKGEGKGLAIAAIAVSSVIFVFILVFVIGFLGYFNLI